MRIHRWGGLDEAIGDLLDFLLAQLADVLESTYPIGPRLMLAHEFIPPAKLEHKSTGSSAGCAFLSATSKCRAKVAGPRDYCCRDAHCGALGSVAAQTLMASGRWMSYKG